MFLLLHDEFSIALLCKSESIPAAPLFPLIDDKNRYYCWFLICSPCCWNFGRDEVGIRLCSGALLLPLDPVFVVILSCLIWFSWTPCCLLAPPSWQPCSSSWSASGDLLCDHGHLLFELGLLWWCFLECSRDEVRKDGSACGVCGCLWWCLSSWSAKLYFALLTFWSKARLCMLILDGEFFWCCHL
jgi:hypothetical protein